MSCLLWLTALRFPQRLHWGLQNHTQHNGTTARLWTIMGWWVDTPSSCLQLLIIIIPEEVSTLWHPVSVIYSTSVCDAFQELSCDYVFSVSLFLSAISGVTQSTAMSVCLSLCPPLWHWWKDLSSYQMDEAMPLVIPEHSWFRMKSLNNKKDCPEICYGHSNSHQEHLE